MSNVEETANTANNILPFKKTKPVPGNKKPTKVNWSASAAEEAIYNRGVAAIETHTDNMMGILVEYMKECEVIDPTKMDLEQFHDITLIKEAIKSTMFRVLGFEHDLHHFVDNMMIIPLPEDNSSDAEE